MLPDDPRHSTYAGGRVHRGDNEEVCEPCRRAEARYEQARLLDRLNGHPRTLPSLGTMRRIQALVALGHSFTRIAEALGDVTPGAAWALAHRMGPDARAARYARTIATKHGWPPPLAWDDIDNDPAPAATVEHLDVDPVVVERILAGDAVNATTAERRAVVARWPETGRSYADLARLTGWKVERYHPTATGLEEDAA
jgi:hypothetical protein